ncbi:hypothetical protein ILYODFUR_029215 [Ilyodon furcidens]|uniref:Uncharacterized protein n=1 Tax=Ilyodon furcidens TaxID=33524 RepID=A0ABV0TZR9_9TELE
MKSGYTLSLGVSKAASWRLLNVSSELRSGVADRRLLLSVPGVASRVWEWKKKPRKKHLSCRTQRWRVGDLDGFAAKGEESQTQSR